MTSKQVLDSDKFLFVASLKKCSACKWVGTTEHRFCRQNLSTGVNRYCGNPLTKVWSGE